MAGKVRWTGDRSGGVLTQRDGDSASGDAAVAGAQASARHLPTGTPLHPMDRARDVFELRSRLLPVSV